MVCAATVVTMSTTPERDSNHKSQDRDTRRKSRSTQHGEFSQTSRAIPFLAAFNDIEAHLRVVLDAKRSDSFWWMVDRARDRHLLSGRQAEVLKDYGNLRNAISHGRYNDGEPIAEPHPEVVKEIENLRVILTNPPQALEVLGRQEVQTVAPDTSVKEVLALIASNDYSQIPVYAGNEFKQLLTTNTITRWVAADLGDNNQIDAATVSEVLKFGEPLDQAVFLPRTVTAQEALDALSEPDAQGTHPFAAIVTETGKPHQSPLRIITTADLGQLIDAVEWD